jgi:LysR family transcriptional activator of nhaA
VSVFNHLIGESAIAFFAAPSLARRLKGRFPGQLDGAPVLLPSESSALRRPLEQWLEQQRVRPVVAGEFDDSALMKSFGEAGAGVFVAPALVAEEVKRQYNVRQIGQTDQVKERLYAVTAERKIEHPAVARILQPTSLPAQKSRNPRTTDA